MNFVNLPDHSVKVNDSKKMDKYFGDYNYRYKFFTPTLANDFSLKFQWQQVSSSLFSFDGLRLSRYFQVFQSLNQSFGDCTKSTNYN